MIKRIFTFSIIAFVLFIATYFLNKYLIDSNAIKLSFSLLQVYLFNVIACLIIYTSIELVSNYLPNETGYLYLALIFMKFGVFLLMFQNSIFSEAGLSKPEKASILAAVFLFLS